MSVTGQVLEVVEMKGLMDDETRLNIRSGQAGKLKSSNQAEARQWVRLKSGLFGWRTRKVKPMDGVDKNSAIKGLSAQISDNDHIPKFGQHTQAWGIFVAAIICYMDRGTSAKCRKKK